MDERQRSEELPCSNCGAQLSYDPGTAALVCPFCGTENELPPEPDGPWSRAEQLRELDYAAAIRGTADAADITVEQTVACPGCGAEVAFGPDTLADQCPFCATPLAREPAHSHRHPKPQGVLPFALTEAEARGRLKRWLGSRWFAPSSLKAFAEAGRPIRGVYIPHYTFDAAGEADYQGMRGDAYYVTQMVSVVQDGKRRRVQQKVRKIRWTRVSGRVRRHFDDVLVPASDTLGELSRPVEADGVSWDLAGLEPYRPEFMAGFRAEAPVVPLEQGFDRAAEGMRAVLTRDARFDIGGDAQKVTHLAARFDAITFKHVLLPVWLAAYRWQNKAFRVVVNGRTGAVTGERPYSVWKIALAALAALVVIGIIALVTSRG